MGWLSERLWVGLFSAPSLYSYVILSVNLPLDSFDGLIYTVESNHLSTDCHLPFHFSIWWSCMGLVTHVMLSSLSESSENEVSDNDSSDDTTNVIADDYL